MELETSQSEEKSTEQLPEQSSEQGQEQATQEQILELESLPKFKYAGRELTAKELQGMVMMQSDYTRKTQAIAEERKYYENLQADLDAVKSNPTLAAQFKQVYPEKFHKFLGYVASKTQQEKPAQNAQWKSQMDPDFLERFNRVEKELNERKVQAIEAELDAKFSKLSKQYPMADEEAVVARAQTLLEKGQKLTDQVWNELWKGVHDRNTKLAEQFYAGKVNQQKTANAKGKDAASGGGLPGQAPKLPRTIKEASDHALKELENLQ